MADKSSAALSEAERKAIKDRAAELRAEKSKKSPEALAAAVLETILELPEPDRTLAMRIHEIVTDAAPQLNPKLWYGMPAYAKDGKVLCFFQPASKFDVRYSTFGFETIAALDDGQMWPTGFAVLEVTDAVARRIRELVTAAVG